MKRSEHPIEQFKQWLHCVFPYIERGLSGAQLRWNLLGALALWVLSALSGLYIVQSDSSLARDWRHSLDLESTKHEAINWPQCGFCVTVMERYRADIIEREMQKSTRQQRESCATDGYRGKACEGLPHELQSALHRMEKPALGLDPGTPWKRSAAFAEPPGEVAWQSAVERDFLPAIELYRSPLSMQDFPRVWGLVAAWGLLPLLVILLPLRIVMRLGASLYHQSWSLLVATQQPVERILAGLVLQAALPVLMAAVPLIATVMVQMLVSQGALGSALGFGLAALTLASVWSAFAVTLSVLAGRRVAPALLVCISMFVGLVYFAVLLESNDSIITRGAASAPLMLLHSGADLWLLAQAKFLHPLMPIAQKGHLRIELVLASALLLVASLRWIGAHARRLQAQLEPALSRRGWYTGWAMGAGVLALRGLEYEMPFKAQEYYGCSNSFPDAGVLSVLLVLLLPLASYLRHAVHPLAHRSELLLDGASWLRAFKESWGAIAIMFGVFLLGSSCRLELMWGIVVSGALVSFFLVVSAWVAMASGLSLLVARGLGSRREKLVCTVVALGTAVAGWIMLLGWFDASSGHWDGIFRLGAMIWLASAGPAFLLLAVEFFRRQRKIEGAE